MFEREKIKNHRWTHFEGYFSLGQAPRSPKFLNQITQLSLELKSLKNVH